MRADPKSGPFPPSSTTVLPGGVPAPYAGLPSSAQSARHPSLLAPELVGRFGETLRANRFTLRNRELLRLEVTRPTILLPLSVVAGIIYFQPDSCPTWSSAAAPTAGASSTPLKSSGPGVCYLHTRGVWWLYYDAGGSGSNLEVLEIAAEDPGVAARYLAEPGVHGETANGAVATATRNITAADALTTHTVPANRDRRSLIIQNTVASGSWLRIGIGTAAASAGAPGSGGGLILGSTQTLTLSGDTLWKGAVSLVPNAGNIVCTIIELV